MVSKIGLRRTVGETLAVALASVLFLIGLIGVLFPLVVQPRMESLILLALALLTSIVVWDRRADREKYERVDASLQKLGPAVGMAQAAIAADVVELFPSRLSPRAQEVISKLLTDPKTTSVSIAAVALPSLFHLGNDFTEEVREALDRHVRFRILALDPRGTMADLRAARELNTTTVENIERSLRSIQEYMDRNLAIEARVYDGTPQVFMLQTDDYLFLEAYHMGRVLDAHQEQVPGCIGGRIPCYLAKRNRGRSPHDGVWDLLGDHFECLWSGHYPDGRRLTVPVYSAVTMSLVEDSSMGWCLQLTNRHRFISVQVAGWTLRVVAADGTPLPSAKTGALTLPSGSAVGPQATLVLANAPASPTATTLALGTQLQALLDEYRDHPGERALELRNRADTIAARLPMDGYVEAHGSSSL
ncbi:MAG TPA: hypothetical protein PLS53_13515 [Thermoanaerobaculaceae bacterium]|nr:hypothetical protein [Thermoanaerobaculaceae bacterium]HPS79171.1 hypothetical protein [Thermoanaerobaculaceae bacterium]